MWIKVFLSLTHTTETCLEDKLEVIFYIDESTRREKFFALAASSQLT